MTQEAKSNGGCYRICGLTLESDTVFPELLSASVITSGPQMSVRLATRLPLVPSPIQWIRQWPLSTGEPWLHCGKLDSGYLIRFHELADFLVDNGGQKIMGTAVQGISPITLRHLLLDHVLPLVLNLRGRDALHATAVATPHGVCAFTGMAGMGKSTLAMSFALTGYPVLSDDCLVIEEQDGRLVAVPAYPGVRLWDDTCAALAPQINAPSPVAHYTDKQRLVWQEQVKNFPTTPLPLQRIYLLTRSSGNASVMDLSAPHIESCPQRQVFMALLEQTFRLDVTDAVMLVRQLHWLERIVTQIPVRRLYIPNDFTALSTVQAVVLRDCASIT